MFPKAKIHRFNEELTCAPPPTAYDPKFDNKVKGVVIEKSKRFAESKLVSATSCESLESTPCSSHKDFSVKDSFRTPQLLKKKILFTPKSENPHLQEKMEGSKIRKKLDDNFKFETEKKLIEQINELTIAHTSQLIEKNYEISSLHNEIDELKKRLSIQANNSVDLDKVRSECEFKLARLKSEHEDLIEKIKNEGKANEKLHQEHLDSLALEFVELKNREKYFESSVENINTLVGETLLFSKEIVGDSIQWENIISNAQTLIQKQIVEYKIDWDSMMAKHELEMDKVCVAFEKALEWMNIRLNVQINQMKTEFNSMANDFASEEIYALTKASQDVNNGLAEFHNATQEISKNFETWQTECNEWVSNFLLSLKKCDDQNENLIEESRNLQDLISVLKISNVEIALKVAEQEQEALLKHENEELRKKLAIAEQYSNSYEIALDETTKTVHVLTNRLVESEKEVERTKLTIDEMEVKLSSMEETLLLFQEEDKKNKENTIKWKSDIVHNVKQVEGQLLGKLDIYCQTASGEVQKLQQIIEEKQKVIELMLAEIDFYESKGAESADCITLYQTRINNYKEEIKELQVKFLEMEDDFKEKIGAQRSLNDILKMEKETLIESIDIEKQNFLSSIENLNKDNSILEKECHEKTEEVNYLKIKIDELTFELNEKQNIELFEFAVLENEKRMKEIEKKYESDVVSLKEKLKDNENKFQEFQFIESTLRRDIDCLENDVATMTEEKFILEEKIESLKRFEDEFAKLNEEKEILEEEVERLRSLEIDLTKLKEIINVNEGQIKELHLQTSDWKSKFNSMENRKNEYKIYAIGLEEERDNLKNDISLLLEEKEKLKEQSDEDSMKCTSLTGQISVLECRNRELENMIGPFRDQLLFYEKERNQLLSKTKTTEQELRALELEHSKSLGHQNHKQKIKHVVNLTDTISEKRKELEKLRNENSKLRNENLKYQQLIEKKLKERSRSNSVKGREKENLGTAFVETSPLSRSKLDKISVTGSPVSISALKERNNL